MQQREVLDVNKPIGGALWGKDASVTGKWLERREEKLESSLYVYHVTIYHIRAILCLNHKDRPPFACIKYIPSLKERNEPQRGALLRLMQRMQDGTLSLQHPSPSTADSSLQDGILACISDEAVNDRYGN